VTSWAIAAILSKFTTTAGRCSGLMGKLISSDVRSTYSSILFIIFSVFAIVYLCYLTSPLTFATEAKKPGFFQNLGW